MTLLKCSDFDSDKDNITTMFTAEISNMTCHDKHTLNNIIFYLNVIYIFVKVPRFYGVCWKVILIRFLSCFANYDYAI